jgi:hypothetical protein
MVGHCSLLHTVIPVNAIHDSLLLRRKMAILRIIYNVVCFLVCIRCAAVDAGNAMFPPIRCVRAWVDHCSCFLSG